MGPRFLFRCDAGRVPEIGTGHARRCIRLASELSRVVGGSSRFLMRDLPGGPDMVRSRGFPVEVFDHEIPEAVVVRDALEREPADIVILDVLDTSPELLAVCRASGAVVVSLDDRGAGLREADIVVNAIREADAADAGVALQGPDYVALASFDAPPARAVREAPLTAFLSFGGHDHHRLTEAALEGVARTPTIEKAIVVATSPVDDLPSNIKVEVHGETSDFAALLASSDVAVVSGGLTLFEAMRCGVPAVAVAQYPHQEETTARYESRGAVLNLGAPGPDLAARVARAVERLAGDPVARAEMGRQGRRSVDGRGLQRLTEAAAVWQPLKWDTEFFGRRIGQMNVNRLTPAIVAYALRSAGAAGIECLYFLADCHHKPTVELAEAHGFHFVDIRLTFERDVREELPPTRDVSVRPARPGDVPHLRAIARNSYTSSRYYFDRHFPRERCEAFYTEWVEKSCHGHAGQVLVAEVDRRPAGYITCTMRRSDLGVIELVGTADWSRGRGTGRALVDSALRWFKAQGADRVEVVTQGRNYDAQRLYQRAGFITRSTQLWYHKWFSEEK